MNVGINMVDPVKRDEMMLAVIGIVLGELDAALAFQMVDRADMAAISGFDFHMLANIVCRYHWYFLLFIVSDAKEMSPAPFRSDEKITHAVEKD